MLAFVYIVYLDYFILTCSDIMRYAMLLLQLKTQVNTLTKICLKVKPLDHIII